MPVDNLSNDDDIFEDVKAAYTEVSMRSEPEPSTVTDRGVDTHIHADKGDREEKTVSRTTPPKDERGRFTRKDADAKAKPVAADADHGDADDGEEEDAAPEASERQEKATSHAGGPPPSWTVKSKAAWDQLPEQVRADIAKRETEVAQGLSALRDYKDLKPYAEMATKHGTTIKKALDHYTGIENLLRRDIGAGLAQIVQNYGLKQGEAAHLFAGLAQRYGAQPTSQPSATPAGQPKPGDPLYEMLKPYLDPIVQRNQQLEQKLTSREEADRNASVQSLAKTIETFSSRPENRYYAELEETITRLFQTGMVPLTGNHEADLRAAYDTAAQMHPEVREALIETRLREQKEAERRKEQEAADKARKASRSLTGSRVPGTVTATKPNGSTDRKSYDEDLQADVLAAIRMHSQH